MHNLKTVSFIGQSKRNLWRWLNIVFNSVDDNRIKDVGPDLACAEWLLRLGAKVKWKNTKYFLSDYNSLPKGGASSRIVEIDATDSAIMHVGFPHLAGLTEVNKVILHKCSYLDDNALTYLPLLKSSLEHLQISSSGSITSSGLEPLKQLRNLQYLLLYDLPEIRNRDEVTSDLQNALPSCKVEFPSAIASAQTCSTTEESKKE